MHSHPQYYVAIYHYGEIGAARIILIQSLVEI